MERATTTEQRCLDAVQRFEDGVMRAARSGVKNVETSVSEALDRAFDLAEQVLARQRELVHELVTEIGAPPETRPENGMAPTAPTTAASRTAPRRAPARRAPAKRAAS